LPFEDHRLVAVSEEIVHEVLELSVELAAVEAVVGSLIADDEGHDLGCRRCRLEPDD